MNRKALCLLSSVFCLLAVAGCRQDMHNQPKYRPLRASTLFADGASARPLVEGTIARGTLQEDEAFYTGKTGNQTVKELPFQMTAADLDRGQERYNIFCAPCHDATGGGQGMIVRRGYRPPPSLHDPRLQAADAGHFFDVMTNGFGAMPDYRTQIDARDRWRIVAYIRALQLTQPPAAAAGRAATAAAGSRGGRSFPGLRPSRRGRGRRRCCSAPD
ncbi:MAG TPA: cytochrome c, partial [Vicinamibacterales bacterium]|nr:cytochrome c [Vicinamibacterales bacterium]